MRTAYHPTMPMTAASASSDLSTQVARLFFDRQLSKMEIAARLGISRFRVARLIDDALADGLVRIEYRDIPADDRGLAAVLEERFGLDLCAVAIAAADEATDEATTFNAVARLAAAVLHGLISSGDVIGVAWGSAVGLTSWVGVGDADAVAAASVDPPPSTPVTASTVTTIAASTASPPAAAAPTTIRRLRYILRSSRSLALDTRPWYPPRVDGEFSPYPAFGVPGGSCLNCPQMRGVGSRSPAPSQITPTRPGVSSARGTLAHETRRPTRRFGAP